MSREGCGVFRFRTMPQHATSRTATIAARAATWPVVAAAGHAMWAGAVVGCGAPRSAAPGIGQELGAEPASVALSGAVAAAASLAMAVAR